MKRPDLKQRIRLPGVKEPELVQLFCS